VASLAPWLGLLPALVLALAASPLGAPGTARRFADRAIIAAVVALLAAVAAALLVALIGQSHGWLIGAGGIGLSLQLDALSAIMLVLVSFVGCIVVRYSRNYLDGDAGHARFTRWLLLTLASVLTLIAAGNLLLLILAWIATSLSLHQLLLFYGDRPAAQRAARKKFAASRLGDACLIGAAALLYAHFGTLEINEMLAVSRVASAAREAGSFGITLPALLVVATALLKSAQMPLHGWLIEVMETPTPVSALLHAGIINAGGFLVLRLADVMLLATPALEVLAIVGGASALIGSLVMLTQTSVKAQLAYSTIAQMGFMLLQCGLGAFSSALLHIVAHSLYKAHAFLSSGSVLDLARASWSPSPGGQPHPARLAIALAAVVLLAIAVAFLFGLTPHSSPGPVALGAILLMGLVHLMAGAIDTRPNTFVLVRTSFAALGVAILYFTLQRGMAWLAAGSLPYGEAAYGPLDVVIASLVVLSFAGLTVFQTAMARHAEQPFWTAAYVHLRHGLYLNLLVDRVLLRLWPRPANPSPSRAASAAPSRV
jgi:NAD(P)H-quinone oxidoreductase subunit 5